MFVSKVLLVVFKHILIKKHLDFSNKKGLYKDFYIMIRIKNCKLFLNERILRNKFIDK